MKDWISIINKLIVTTILKLVPFWAKYTNKEFYYPWILRSQWCIIRKELVGKNPMLIIDLHFAWLMGNSAGMGRIEKILKKGFNYWSKYRQSHLKQWPSLEKSMNLGISKMMWKNYSLYRKTIRKQKVSIQRQNQWIYLALQIIWLFFCWIVKLVKNKNNLIWQTVTK